MLWRLHCCAAAGDGAGDTPQTLPAARGDRPGELPPSTGHHGPAAQQVERDTAFCTNPPPPSPRQPPSPGPPVALIRFLPVIILVGIPIVAVLVLLGEVSLRAQGRERQEPGAGADSGE